MCWTGRTNSSACKPGTNQLSHLNHDDFCARCNKACVVISAVQRQRLQEQNHVTQKLPTLLSRQFHIDEQEVTASRVQHPSRGAKVNLCTSTLPARAGNHLTVRDAELRVPAGRRVNRKQPTLEKAGSKGGTEKLIIRLHRR